MIKIFFFLPHKCRKKIRKSDFLCRGLITGLGASVCVAASTAHRQNIADRTVDVSLL